jgi:NAD(P)-dependent dehydrogenase (short-subunit alcohol dehydrogenase family)
MPGKNEPPRVLVTGASGKIGGAVATALDGTHREVIAVRASPAAHLDRRERPALNLETVILIWLLCAAVAAAIAHVKRVYRRVDRPSQQGRGDVDLRGQGLMNRATFGDVQQPLPLNVVEVAG